MENIPEQVPISPPSYDPTDTTDRIGYDKLIVDSYPFEGIGGIFKEIAFEDLLTEEEIGKSKKYPDCLRIDYFLIYTVHQYSRLNTGSNDSPDLVLKELKRINSPLSRKFKDIDKLMQYLSLSYIPILTLLEEYQDLAEYVESVFVQGVISYPNMDRKYGNKVNYPHDAYRSYLQYLRDSQILDENIPHEGIKDHPDYPELERNPRAKGSGIPFRFKT